MSRPLWFVQLLKKAFPSRYLLAKATNLPLLGPLTDHLFFDGDDLFYVPKTKSIAINQPVLAPDEVVLPSLVVEHFIHKASVHWIMDTCICRAASDCHDYPIDLGCLFLGEAAKGINPELGHRVSLEEALNHVQKCREAGLVHLIGRNKLDTIWLGVGPGTRLLTICNCCPCCCLWRVLPYVSPQISAKISRMPGITVMVSDRCVGCGTCTLDVCFVDAIRLNKDRSHISETCRGCGRCVAECPEGAIEITFETNHFVKDAIAKISPLVDID